MFPQRSSWSSGRPIISNVDRAAVPGVATAPFGHGIEKTPPTPRLRPLSTNAWGPPPPRNDGRRKIVRIP